MPITMSVVTDALSEIGYDSDEAWKIALKIKQAHDKFEEEERMELEIMLARTLDGAPMGGSDELPDDGICANQFGMEEKEYRQEMAIWNRDRG